MLINIKKPDFVFSDERGTINQLVHEGYKQFNIVTTKKGAKRGRMHYHKLNKELFFVVSGRIVLTVTDGVVTEEYNFSEGDMFEVPPFIRHDFEFCEDTILAGMYDFGVENNSEKDIFE